MTHNCLQYIKHKRAEAEQQPATIRAPYRVQQRFSDVLAARSYTTVLASGIIIGQPSRAERVKARVRATWRWIRDLEVRVEQR